MEAGRLWPHDIVKTLVKNFNEVKNSTKLKKKNLNHQLLGLISSDFFITILKKIPPKV